MKASELRIGNYLALPTRGEDVVIVEEIFANDFVVCDASSNEWPITDYAPIPITEDWLIRLGFEFDNETGSWSILTSLKKFDYLFEISNKFQEYYQPDFMALDIKYVHQLQNLYFTLTGEELKIQ